MTLNYKSLKMDRKNLSDTSKLGAFFTFQLSFKFSELKDKIFK